MSANVLLAFATDYGSTRDVADAVADALNSIGLTVDVQPARQVRSIDQYSAIILGAPLYMFHWHKDALRFLSRFRAPLAKRPVVIFALGPVHEPHDDKEWQGSRAQLDKELAQFSWLEPVALKLFGGRIDPAHLSFPIRLFAGNVPASDLRDWNAIRDWAAMLPPLLAQ